eukprot:TRINITY_DN13512_c0_g2_i2.p1 TRINITY_DN13512_c0_g2~~TRINITY_DN13512_c0_g2_i2.p1  ORF type:complete len:421 (-),score=82.84 TRINITY_DN13512_c0_g2_i2:479-1741(-)
MSWEFLVYRSSCTNVTEEFQIIKLLLSKGEILAPYINELSKENPTLFRYGIKNPACVFSTTTHMLDIPLTVPVECLPSDLCKGKIFLVENDCLENKVFHKKQVIPNLIASRLLCGETYFKSIPNAETMFVRGGVPTMVMGMLWITNYRFIFEENEDFTCERKLLSFYIPLSTIVTFKGDLTIVDINSRKHPIIKQSNETKSLTSALNHFFSELPRFAPQKPKIYYTWKIMTSDFRKVKLLWLNVEGWETFKDVVLDRSGGSGSGIGVGSGLSGICYFYNSNLERIRQNLDENSAHTKWSIYDRWEEYKRLKLTYEGWKVLDVKKVLSLASGYMGPNVVVPELFMDDPLSLSKIFMFSEKFYKKRFPTLSWATHSYNNFVLLRSERPALEGNERRSKSSMKLTNFEPSISSVYFQFVNEVH